jgi:hypothetical protein
MQTLAPAAFCGWGCICGRWGVAKRSACLRHDLSFLLFTVSSESGRVAWLSGELRCAGNVKNDNS